MNNDTQATTEAPVEQEKVVTGQSTPEVVAEATNEDPNWKAFREARKKDRIEKEAAERKAQEKEAEVSALKAALEASLDRRPAQGQSQVSGYYPYNNDSEETEDERIEKKVQAALAVREQAAERQRQEREHQEYPQRLNQQYPDFNAIVTAENLDYLEYHYPEVARPLKRLTDNYDKWADVYQTLKKFVPNAAVVKQQVAKAESNLLRPKSMSAVGSTQNTEGTMSHKLSEDRKQANWERMQKTLRGLS